MIIQQQEPLPEPKLKHDIYVSSYDEFGHKSRLRGFCTAMKLCCFIVHIMQLEFLCYIFLLRQNKHTILWYNNHKVYKGQAFTVAAKHIYLSDFVTYTLYERGHKNDRI